MSSELVTETQSPPRGGSQRQQPGNLTVSFDSAAGTTSDAPVTRVDRSAHLAKVLGPKEAIVKDEHGAVVQQEEAPAEEAQEAAPAEGEGTEQEAAGEVEPVEADADAEEAPAEVEADTATPAHQHEIERLRLELANSQRALADYTGTVREERYEQFVADPVTWLRGQIAEALGVDAADPMVAAEQEALFGELTFSAIDVNNLPSEQRQSLKSDRVDRKLRLETHRRQAEKKQSQNSTQVDASRRFARTVFESSKTQFPFAELAERRYGRTLDELIVDVVNDGVQRGYIKDWDKRDTADLVTEAIRLIDTDSRTWAAQLSPQLASLLSASAPAAPGASSQPTAAKKIASPPAAPKPGQNAKPATLAPRKAGAAPTRPGTKPKVEPLSKDPAVRAKQVIERFMKP